MSCECVSVCHKLWSFFPGAGVLASDALRPECYPNRPTVNVMLNVVPVAAHEVVRDVLRMLVAEHRAWAHAEIATSEV